MMSQVVSPSHTNPLFLLFQLLMIWCGICNADDWCTLEPSEVSGQVPQSVCEVETEFYQCGKCRQIFWNGEKYANTMDSLNSTNVASAGKSSGTVRSTQTRW